MLLLITAGTVAVDMRVQLTDNLQVDTRRVFHIFNLHLEIILSRVFSFGFADEEDRVYLAVPHAGKCWGQGLLVFAPCDLRPGFTLEYRVIQTLKQESARFTCSHYVRRDVLRFVF